MTGKYPTRKPRIVWDDHPSDKKENFVVEEEKQDKEVIMEETKQEAQDEQVMDDASSDKTVTKDQ